MTSPLNLAEICGDFCTERSHPKMNELKQLATKAIEGGVPLKVNRSGVKLLGTSFLDEWLSELAARYGKSKVLDAVVFDPPLEAIHLAQLDRGIRLRSARV